MKATYVIEGRANTVIRHKALVHQVLACPRISDYGRVMLYPPKK